MCANNLVAAFTTEIGSGSGEHADVLELVESHDADFRYKLAGSNSRLPTTADVNAGSSYIHIRVMCNYILN